MSYSTVYGLWPNSTKRVELAEFRNAWGMAPVVWRALARRYLGPEPLGGYMQQIDQLWPLHERADLPVHHRAVLRMTFDTRYIANADRKRAADDIRLWLRDFAGEIESDAANHWPVFAALLVAKRDKQPPVIGVHQTSVSENPWDGPYDEATEERGPFDWSTAESVYKNLVAPKER